MSKLSYHRFGKKKKKKKGFKFMVDLSWCFQGDGGEGVIDLLYQLSLSVMSRTSFEVKESDVNPFNY